MILISAVCSKDIKLEYYRFIFASCKNCIWNYSYFIKVPCCIVIDPFFYFFIRYVCVASKLYYVRVTQTAMIVLFRASLRYACRFFRDRQHGVYLLLLCFIVYSGSTESGSPKTFNSKIFSQRFSWKKSTWM